MLPLHDVAIGGVERPQRRAKKLSYAFAESDTYATKTHF